MTLLWVLSWAVGVVVVGVHAWHVYRTIDAQVERVKGAYGNDLKDAVCELVQFAQSYEACEPDLVEKVGRMKDPFVREAAQGVLDGTLRGHELLRALRQKAQTFFVIDMNHVRRLVRANETVPAMGWALAIITTFYLLRAPEELSGARVVWAIGGLAIFALYGLVFSYLLVRPAVGYLTYKAKMRRLRNQVVVEGIGGLLRNQKAFEILDSVNLVLPADQRVDWQAAFPGSRKAAA